jgi:NAD(P)-dependent dehydrogenase (short-subunit alcohol dehydrogenase family)
MTTDRCSETVRSAIRTYAHTIAQFEGSALPSSAAWSRCRKPHGTRSFAVNLKSAYLTMKHVIPMMDRQGSGSIINISWVAVYHRRATHSEWGFSFDRLSATSTCFTRRFA